MFSSIKQPILQTIAVAIVCALFSGCLELEQSIAIRRNGTIVVSFDYVIDSTFADIGVIEGSSNSRHISTLPLNRQDFERLDALHNDIALNRYSKRIRSSHYRITARLTFETIDAFNRVFTISTPDTPMPTSSLRIDTNGLGGNIALSFVGVPTTSESESETTRLFAELDALRTSSIAYTIRTPHPIQSVVYPPAHPIEIVRRINTNAILQPSIQMVQKKRTLTLHASLSSALVVPPQSSVTISW